MGLSNRNITDFNREYEFKLWLREEEELRKPRKGAVVKSILFYGFLLAMVTAAFFFSNTQGGKQIGPFAYNNVLSESMQSVYPKGSLVVSWAVKSVDELSAGLADGTDIVFLKEDGQIVVHRIIEIMDNYEDSGLTAFRTQGVENDLPDSWVTYAGNVVGKVIWHLPYLGGVLAFIADNLLWVILSIVVIFSIIALLRFVFGKEDTPQSADGIVNNQQAEREKQ
ncbi:MAG: signal peptidase I [Clostridium sp.]|jgi:signal peptidase|nr:signal peptidase I [Clostridium sp.]